jgi:hypothetical protein
MFTKNQLRIPWKKPANFLPKKNPERTLLQTQKKKNLRKNLQPRVLAESVPFPLRPAPTPRQAESEANSWVPGARETKPDQTVPPEPETEPPPLRPPA